MKHRVLALAGAAIGMSALITALSVQAQCAGRERHQVLGRQYEAGAQDTVGAPRFARCVDHR